jgi:hypothetical protein
MRTLYLRKEDGPLTRKVILDMAYIATNRKIRMLKYLFEDGMYLPFFKNRKQKSDPDRHYLTRDKIIKEDKDFYYFKFPFKAEQVEDIAI